ncbi:chemotaxis protein methyltransferase CheR [Bacillus pakistanensis]|uniref:protein-glutamate O-methyltransferase n=1 Tax=Rossellomorea pakistanensis TaxID=992288 RepID=A0ABS2N933_9BACI|nr:protein-glutamate O-methyltransferase CheR [Bacillus pakistanensis]MBM7584348.1 chemotaxis protein methyltransferase CheR [Bacillus pakistanensis]
MTNDYPRFVESIKVKTGIDLSLYKEEQMKRRLTSFFQKKGFKNFNELYKELDCNSHVLNEFLDRMTINVTEFYRNYKRWEVLQNKILPTLICENSKPKIWSAACSTGEEPYTIAMVLNQFMPYSQIAITASDIDGNAIMKAKRGVFSERSLNEVPNEIRKKYFTRNGEFYKISDEIKQTVIFNKHNLLADKFDQMFDLIICRNVLIYFTEEAKSIIYKKFSDALRPGGVLFVGSTEQIFHPQTYGLETEETFFYRKK